MYCPSLCPHLQAGAYSHYYFPLDIRYVAVLSVSSSRPRLALLITKRWMYVLQLLLFRSIHVLHTGCMYFSCCCSVAYMFCTRYCLYTQVWTHSTSSSPDIGKFPCQIFIYTICESNQPQLAVEFLPWKQHFKQVREGTTWFTVHDSKWSKHMVYYSQQWNKLHQSRTRWKAWNYRWNKMEQPGTRWSSLDHGTRWNKLGQSGTTWDKLIQSGKRWNSQEQGETGWNKLEHPGTRWNSLE